MIDFKIGGRPLQDFPEERHSLLSFPPRLPGGRHSERWGGVLHPTDWGSPKHYSQNRKRLHHQQQMTVLVIVYNHVKIIRNWNWTRTQCNQLWKTMTWGEEVRMQVLMMLWLPWTQHQHASHLSLQVVWVETIESIQSGYQTLTNIQLQRTKRPPFFFFFIWCLNDEISPKRKITVRAIRWFKAVTLIYYYYFFYYFSCGIFKQSAELLVWEKIVHKIRKNKIFSSVLRHKKKMTRSLPFKNEICLNNLQTHARLEAQTDLFMYNQRGKYS